MEGDPHEVHASSRCFCSFSIIISAFILVVYILALNKACRYFIKMTAFYLTILINAIMCCFACMPIYFFGDVSKFIFNAFYYFSYWTRISCDLRHGEYFKSDSPFIVVCNHQSSLDVVMLSNIWPSKCTIMMKRSLLWMPFFNYACLLANVIFVDRTNHKKAVQSLQECGDRIKKKNLSVWVFPEGTRNHDGGLLEFKKGAFNIAVQAGIPVVPCVISSYRPFYNKDDRYFADTGYVIVEVLKPISTKNMTLEDVPKLAEDVRGQMMETYERISKEAAEEYYRRTGIAIEEKKGK